MVPETPKITVTFDAHSGEVTGSGSSGDVVATNPRGGRQVYVWDMVPETPKITVTFDAHSGEVTGSGISGDVVATGVKRWLYVCSAEIAKTPMHTFP